MLDDLGKHHLNALLVGLGVTLARLLFLPAIVPDEGDVGNVLHPPTVFTDLYDYETKGPEVFGAEYLYLFVDGQWIACDLSRTPHEWGELENMLQE